MKSLRLIFIFQFCSSVFPCVYQGEACSLTVMQNNKVCEEEAAFVAARAPFVKSATKKFLGLESTFEKEVPTISICMSGGGYRAMIASTGFMLGASQIGLIDSSSYVTLLSGSSWFMLNFLLHKKFEDTDLSTFREKLKARVTVPFLDPSKFKMGDFIRRMANVFVARGKIEPADVIGAFFADKLWSDLGDPQKFTFKDIAPLFKDGSFNFPFPLFTLVLSDVFPYEWLEVNPFVTGSDYLSAQIPTSAFDSKFKEGKCTALLPEQSLAWFAGMFGSAYNFSFGDIFILLIKALNDVWLTGVMNQVVHQYCLYESRMLPSPVYNFVYKFGSTFLSAESEFEISDAGMSFNIPIPPILKTNRMSDVIIVCDASSDASVLNYPELRYAAAYFKRKGIKFPNVDKPNEVSDYVAIFEDESDKTVPTVIYFANPVYASTVVFDYPAEEYDEMCDSMKKEVIEHKNIVIDAIKRKIK
jgi:cytosolic phospholipase A2